VNQIHLTYRSTVAPKSLWFEPLNPRGGDQAGAKYIKSNQTLSAGNGKSMGRK